jgi:multidrug efflux pump subunit AcrB
MNQPPTITVALDVAEPTGFMLRQRKSILFFTLLLCFAGASAAYTMPSAVFPQTDFPRVVVLIDNGVMPADEMMATITRPVEESLKYIPGSKHIRSSTSRGSAAVNVFFNWGTNMEQAELYVLGRLSEIRSKLPPHAEFAVHRLTFSAFPILGVSLTSKTRSETELWEKARYDIYPRFLRIQGVARINLVGGKVPEYHVIVDPVKLDAYGLTLAQVSQALAATNQFTPAGMHEENHQLYLSVVDNRLRRPEEIPEVVIGWSKTSPVRIRDVAEVRPGEAPQFRIVTADGAESVLLNVYSQPDGNTVGIANALERELELIRRELPPDMKMAFFYDQSQFVREGVRSVWESIILGLILSILVLYAFLRNVAVTAVAAAVIPVCILLTLIGLRLLGMSFNLMTLGGIAACVGLVIDDAIVVVEAIFAKV